MFDRTLYYETGLDGTPLNRKFNEIWPTFGDFQDDYKDCELPMSTYFVAYSDAAVKQIYYLLFARYGNSSIASFDETQFKYQIFSTILDYGPTWLERLNLQKKIRALTDDEIARGSSTIYNHAFNPETAPTTQTMDELTYINDQNVSKFKKSPLEAYGLKWQLLDTDVTEPFLQKFKRYFIFIVSADRPILYPEVE